MANLPTELVPRWKCTSYCRCGSRKGHFERRDDGAWVRFDDVVPLRKEIERMERELADMTSDYLRVHKAFCDLKYPETAQVDVSQNLTGEKR